MATVAASVSMNAHGGVQRIGEGNKTQVNIFLSDFFLFLFKDHKLQDKQMCLLMITNTFCPKSCLLSLFYNVCF